MFNNIHVYIVITGIYKAGMGGIGRRGGKRRGEAGRGGDRRDRLGKGCEGREAGGDQDGADVSGWGGEGIGWGDRRGG